MSGDPRSMVGKSPDRPGPALKDAGSKGLKSARAQLAAGVLRKPPAPRDRPKTGAGVRPVPCEHPATIRDATDRVICVDCHTPIKKLRDAD